MAGKEELTLLLERVQKATGPDREIDFLIQIHLVSPLTGEEKYTLQDVMDDYALLGPEGMTIDAPYTASLDAITALIERQLPGRSIATMSHGETMPNAIIAATWMDQARTLPLALCAAFLQALIAEVQA